MNNPKDPWSQQTIIEPDTGKIFTKYHFKHKPAYTVVVDSPKAKALAGYALIEKDLRSAIIWLNTIMEILAEDKKWAESKGHHKATHEREQLNLVKGLFVAALTFYGKSFSKCKGRRIKLEERHLAEEFQDDHELAMAFRHNFAAHSGAENLEWSRVVIALEKKNKTLPRFSIELMQPDTLCRDNLVDFLKLFEHAKEFTDKKIEVLTLKVKEDIVSKGSEYWYKKVTSSNVIFSRNSKW